MNYEVHIRESSGRIRKVSIQAANAAEASAQASNHLQQGDSIAEIEQVLKHNPKKEKPLSKDNVSEFCLDMAGLTKGGHSFSDALGIVLQLGHTKRVQAMVKRMIDGIKGGASIVAVFKAEEALLGSLPVTLMFQAEETKTYDTALEMASGVLDRQIKQKSILVGALTMPLISAGVLTAVVLLALLVIVPMFKEHAAGSTNLLLITRMLFFTSDLAVDYWQGWVPGSIFGLYILIRNPKIKMWAWGQIIRRYPAARRSFGPAEAADFGLFLGSLLKAGVGMQKAMSICAMHFKGTRLGKQLELVVPEVSNGSDLFLALQRHTTLDPRILAAVLIGSKTEKMSAALLSESERLYVRADRAFTKFSNQMTMIILGLMFVSVLTVYIGIYTPMVEIMSRQRG